MKCNLKKREMNHYAVHLKLIQHCKPTILELKKKRETEND